VDLLSRSGSPSAEKSGAGGAPEVFLAALGLGLISFGGPIGAPLDVAIAVVGFVLLARRRTPPILVVLLTVISAMAAGLIGGAV
jgi:hypothetical protein